MALWSRAWRLALLSSLLLGLACNNATSGSLPPFGFACNPGNPPAKDVDGDGWEAPSDCDDGDPLVHPGANEQCNGLDDNCNGVVDEYTTRTLPYLVAGQAGDAPLRYPFTPGGQPKDPEDFPSQLSGGDEAAALLMGDLDGDGIDDVVLQSANTGTVWAFTIDCDDGFDRRELFTPPHAEQRVRGIGDVDGDGDQDLVTFSPLTLSGITWLNDGEAGFSQVETAVDWGALDLMGTGGRLAASATLADLSGDGNADWLMCRGKQRTTHCLVAEALEDGVFSHPESLFSLDDLEASSVALGYFGDDDQPDLFLGLFAEPISPDEYEIPVCVIHNLSLQTSTPAVACPFDLGVEIQSGSLGFQPDSLGNGWFRTVNLDRLDEEFDELLIVLEAAEDLQDGVVLLYVQYPLDVTPTHGFDYGEIRPLERAQLPPTSSSDPALWGAVATAMTLE